MVRVHSDLPFSVAATFSTCDFLPVIEELRPAKLLALRVLLLNERWRCSTNSAWSPLHEVRRKPG
jgi:hypothetical protein